MNPRLLLLVGFGVLGGLILAELVARAVFRDGVPLRVIPGASDTVFEGRPGSVSRTIYGTFSYDENGFRIGSGLPFDRSVLFVGDSFTEGFGVGDDDTFARAAERSLRGEGLMVRSLNAGNRGFGPAQELKILRRILTRMQIDAVVVQAFPMNDFSDNLAYGGFGIETGALVEYDKPKLPWLAVAAAELETSWLRDVRIVRLAANAMFGGYGPAPYESPESFDLERALMNELIATAKQRNLPVVVLLVPSKVVQQMKHGGALVDVRQAEEAQRFEYVRELVQAAGVPWVDASEVIADLESDAARSDGAHFSREGNASVGEAIAHELAPLLRAASSSGATR